MATRPTVIILGGPTASGKTGLAIQLAKAFNTQILSADSRQCYKEMNIGVARPSLNELAAVSHAFIASHSITNPVDAADYENYALSFLAEFFKNSDIAILVGGTGLYIRALMQGLDAIPKVDEAVANLIANQYEAEGKDWLIAQLQEKDPNYLTAFPEWNNHRYQRALGVQLTTGKSILSFRTEIKKERPFNIINVALTLERNILYNNINARVDQMLANGLVAEVEGLKNYALLAPLQTIGYKEVFEYFDGACKYEQMVEKIKQHTRNYAKRQVTWFTHQDNYTQVVPDYLTLYETIAQKLKSL
jgi:tRNA dimethylallyltransferase